MPGVTLHFVLAERSLERWRSTFATLPFDPDDLDASNAFFHGAVGPDLGYFPGGATVLSDLAHCVRPGGLTRALLRAASSDVERAYAWGWVTHVLADQAIHPLIGRGVGELLEGRRDRFVDGSSNLLAHVRVEMGVDSRYARLHPEARGRRLRQAFDERGAAFLARAYAATYGTAFPAALFDRSHQAATRRAGQALASLGLVEALMDERAGGVVPGVRWALRAVYRAPSLRSVALAYLNPVCPGSWLVEAIDRTAPQVVSAFLEAVRSEGRSLEDLNLDTGRPCEREVDHPGTHRALEGLLALGGRRPRPLAARADVPKPALPHGSAPADRVRGGRPAKA